MGLLYPVLVEDCIPGDVWNISNEIIIRFHQPLFAPLLHEVNVYVHTYFVPYRILWNNDRTYYARTLYDSFPGNWEDFLSGGIDGDLELPLPKAVSIFNDGVSSWRKKRGSNTDFIYGVANFGPVTPKVECPVLFPYQAYAFIYNEFYRDENLVDEAKEGSQEDLGLFRRSWEKDYFTSSLPWRQRGTSPAMPIYFNGKAVFDGVMSDFTATPNISNYFGVRGDSGNSVILPSMGVSGVGGISPGNASDFSNFLASNHISPQQLTSFNINDLRLGFQVQKWLERNARAGVRYTELLRAHFNIAPRDERLDRPEYIGGTKSPVIFSEVVKTSDSSTGVPQGYLTGHGLTADRGHVAKYRVKEFGVIMSLMSIMPRTLYSQGVERMWLRDTKYDYYWPEFAHLSEQPIFEEEIRLYPSDSGVNREIFGYQGRYDEYRQRRSTVHGNLKPGGTLDYWHLGREFSDDVSSRPRLNKDFVECHPRKDIYPVPTYPGMIVNYGNICTVVRPLPLIADPGLVDHY
jgi:hypothetical protein